MKIEKKHWIIIGVVVAIIAVWYFFLRKKKAESNFKNFAPPFKGTVFNPYGPMPMGARVSPQKNVGGGVGTGTGPAQGSVGYGGACNASAPNQCAGNMICKGGRCVHVSGSSWGNL